MKPAQCHACGESVLSLKNSSIKLLPKAVCQFCGRNVTKRGGRGELIAVLMFLGVALSASSSNQDWRQVLMVWVGYGLDLTARVYHDDYAQPVGNVQPGWDGWGPPPWTRPPVPAAEPQ